MVRLQPADVVARVEQALMLMEKMGWGVDKAAKFVVCLSLFGFARHQVEKEGKP